MLSNYPNPRTYETRLNSLTTYLDWLQREKEVYLDPDELIRDNLECIHGSKPTDVETKRKHTDWLNEYVNVVQVKAGLGDSRRHQVADSVWQFYLLNDAELHGHFKVTSNYVANPPKALTADDIRKVLAAMPIGQRAPLLMIWQSGIEVNRVLGLKWSQLDLSTIPVKIEFYGRKLHRKGYFTFIGKDGVENLKIWKGTQAKLLGREANPDDPVFLGKQRFQKPGLMTVGYLNTVLHRTALALFKEGMVKNGDKKAWTTHKLRHSFETEASHAGVKAEVRDFFMGHMKGIQWIYNHRDEVHPEDLVQEYPKIEQYVSLKPNVKSETGDRVRLLEKQVAFLRSQLDDIVKGLNLERSGEPDNAEEEWQNTEGQAVVDEINAPYRALRDAKTRQRQGKK